jgi:hypothetical protein
LLIGDTATGKFIATNSGSHLTIKPTAATGKNWAALNYTTYGLIGEDEFLNVGLDGATLEVRQVITISGQIQIPD